MKRVLPQSCRKWLFESLFSLSIFICTYSYFPVVADAYTITVTVDRTVPTDLSVGGDINSNPLGISCTDGTSGVCSYLFTDNIEITLAVNPNWKSNFVGWGTPCTASGTGSCVFTPTVGTTVNATFSPNYQATILGHGGQFTTLTETYANASNGSTVAAHPVSFDEDLIVNQPLFVYLYGGRDEIEYLKKNGNTTLLRTLNVQNGYLVVDRMIVRDLEIGQGVVEVDSLTIQ